MWLRLPLLVSLLWLSYVRGLLDTFVNTPRRLQLRSQLIVAARAKDEPAVLRLIDELAPLNPTKIPTAGLGGGGTGAPPLDGLWTLLFTNARDAEAPARTENRLGAFGGKDAIAAGVQIATGQRIDAMSGLCTNFIAASGEKRPFDRLEIDIRMTALTPQRVRLDFERGRAQNERAPLPPLRDVAFAFPPPGLGDFLCALRGRDPAIEPQAFFDILYIDDQIRFHRTGEGKVFVQARGESAAGPRNGATVGPLAR